MFGAIYNWLFGANVGAKFVYNRERNFGAANGYYMIGPVNRLEITVDGKKVTVKKVGKEVLLFTGAELKKARDRARKNLEDIPVGWKNYVSKGNS